MKILTRKPFRGLISVNVQFKRIKDSIFAIALIIREHMPSIPDDPY